jgi:hypothetical protein
MSKKDKNGKGEHKKTVKTYDRGIKDREKSSERNEYKNKLKNFVSGDYSHLDEDDLDDFE